MKRRPPPESRRQFTSLEVRDALLDFIQIKFYQGDQIGFAKDRPRLLQWVVFKFAGYLNSHGVTVTSERYLEIVRDTILMDAVRFGNTSSITYRPAWLGRVIDSHLAIHGEEYYYAAKTVRDASRGALAIAKQAIGQSDPVRELATASRLLKPKKQAPKSPIKDQLTLL